MSTTTSLGAGAAIMSFLLLVFTIGFSSGRGSIANDCSSIGKFRDSKVVYACSRIESTKDQP